MEAKGGLSAPFKSLVREDTCIVDRDPPYHDLTKDKKFSSLLSIDDKLYGHMHAPCCTATNRGFLVVREQSKWTTVEENPESCRLGVTPVISA